MKRSSGLWLLAWILFSVGCGGGGNKNSLPSGWTEKVKGDIHVAALLSYTGVWAVGTGQERGIVVALDEINSNGGINGKKLGLLVADDSGDRQTGVSLLEALYQQKKVGAAISASRSIVMIGSGSGETGVAQLSTSNKILIVSPSATSPVISTLEDEGYVFRTTPSDEVQTLALAKVAIREGFNRCYIAQLKGDAALIGQRKVFIKTFEPVKGVGSAPFYEFDNAQAGFAQDILTRAKAQWAPAIPDAIVLASFTADSAAIINASGTFNWGGTPPKWLMVDGSKEDKLIQSLSSPTLLREDNAFGVIPSAPAGADFNSFATAYQAVFSEEPQAYASNSYDATYMIAAAMVAANDPNNGEELKEKILLTGPKAGQATTPTKFHPGQWAEMSAAMKTSGHIDYEGSSGDVNFDENGDVYSNVLEWTVSNGNIVWRQNGCWTSAGVPCQ